MRAYKKWLLLMVCAAVMSFTALAQTIDQQLEQARSIKSKDPQQFISILDDLRSQQAQFSDEQRYLFELLEGYRVGFAGEPLKSIEKYKSVIEGTSNTSLKAQALVALLNIYAITRNFNEGYQVVSDLLPYTTEPDNSIKAQAFAGIALFYNQAGDYANAAGYAAQAVQLTDEPRLACFASNLELEAFFYLDKLKNDALYRSTLSACKIAEESVAIGMTMLFEAKRLHKQGAENSALSLLLDNQDIFDATNYPRVQADYWATLASLLMNTQQWDQAFAASQRAIELSTTMQASRPRVEGYQVLYQVYEQRGEPALALDAYKQYSALDKAYLDDLQVRQLAAVQAKNRLQEKENEIALLDQQNALLRAKTALSDKQNQNNQLIIVLLFLLTVCGVTWALYSRHMNRELQEIAHTDGLTKVNNRRHFTNLSEAALAYHKRTAQPMAFIIFDLDLFKRINDNYGHVIGDWALKAAVSAAKSLCRKQDVFGRLGGEEFALLLPGCTNREAARVAEHCRKAIEAVDSTPTGAEFTLTASFGVSDTIQCGYDFDVLYANADSALYSSKDLGRNRVYIYRNQNVSPLDMGNPAQA